MYSNNNHMETSTRQCNYVFTRGFRRNQRCNDSICNDSYRFCRRHYNINRRRQQQLLNELQINFDNAISAIENIEEDINNNLQVEINIGGITTDENQNPNEQNINNSISYLELRSEEENPPNENEEENPPNENDEENPPNENDEENSNSNEEEKQIQEDVLTVDTSESRLSNQIFPPIRRVRRPLNFSSIGVQPRNTLNNLSSYNLHSRRNSFQPPLYSYLNELDEEKESLLQEIVYETCKCCNEKINEPKVILYCECQYHLKCFSLFKEDDKCINCNDKIYKVNDEDFITCSICIEPIKDKKKSTKTLCNHIFHKKCLTTWKTSFQLNCHKCPNCRNTI